jgi:predicted deacetylase
MRNAVESVEDNTVLLSMHDITPFHEEDIVRTCDTLSSIGISSLTLLVTPFYAMKKSNSFTKGSLFTEYLLSLDLEISLHGYSHFTKSGTMHEFSNMTTQKATSRIKDGVNLIRSSFGIKPTGFIPPLWEAPPRIIKSAKDLGFAYGVEHRNIHRFSDSKVFSTGAQIISQGQRIINSESAIFEMELGGSLQIAIHPADHRMNDILDLLTDLKDRRDYRFQSYRDYLSRNK